ncbi:PREDICTED: probable E3 ubiquitin-protein ligase RHG1A [Tarenaya hassleriana]|uniref:probable E3 ubiquitin-protein ligase RHG1A n=1 Tax=Tarenaya hassleriana TaxID=28532 RepID=UPI00053C3C57|nr:PREDICTED: probable E3 ubiquitin-protein ligase RHG1A [Tarenaya hassleriana]
MGSGGSKTCRGSAGAAVSGSDGGRRIRSRSHWSIPSSSCLSSASASNDSDDDGEQVCSSWMRKSHGSTSRRRMTPLETEGQENADCYKGLKEKDDEYEKPCISSDELELDEHGEASVTNLPMRNGGSVRASSSRSLNTPGRIFSHFRFIPGNISSRLSRASSSRSMNAYPDSSNDLDGVTSPLESTSSFTDRNESRRGNHFSRGCIQGFEAPTGTLLSNCSTYNVSDDYQHEHRVPMADNVVRDFGAMRVGEVTNMCSPTPRTASHPGSNYAGVLDRRPVVREPSERNVRFSRTLSVGRLRDRVLRRSSLSDFSYPRSQHPDEGSDTTSASQATTSAAENSPMLSRSILGHSPSSIRRSLFGIQDHEMQTPRAREGRYRDLLEHRSNFLERRRRIRSQVRALQRLGTRFENVSGHDRSCALTGPNQAGRCTCHASNRGGASTADETNASASISRLVMLAEALFEVLDEIHQQSVVLSSEPSVSPIGSVPAPNNVVDLLPVKPYTKSHAERNEEASSQCYICLLEYEEGDTIRTLPCHHEFHRTCVDKWLKEIHRVCPLCRGDICKAGLFPDQRNS